jgi:hypothetical protein
MAQYAIHIFAPVLDDDKVVTAADLEPHERYSDDLTKSGVMIAAFALEDVSAAATIRGDIITDGPFVESKEVVAGFYVIEARDLDAALAIARQNPILRQGGGVEIRPVKAWKINRLSS